MGLLKYDHQPSRHSPLNSQLNNSLAQSHARATEVARASYGRLVAILSAKSGDILAAEDALSDAFQRALEVWPNKGVPDNPEAWLFTTARNRLIDAARKHKQQTSDTNIDKSIADFFVQEQEMETTFQSLPDERLKLLFVCAHPAIDAKIHTPLMLQTVLGLDAQAIGNAFLIAPTSMAQRLVRAKHKIKDAGIPFIIPELNHLTERLDAILEAIYGAFTVDWQGQQTSKNQYEPDQNFSEEAFYLVNLLLDFLPDEPEVLGLTSLFYFSTARGEARYDKHGSYIPLEEQKTALWDKTKIDRANILLNKAHKLKKLGRFQLEAAIQSVHCNRWNSKKTDWNAIAQLYEGLLKIAPTIGGAVGRALAMGKAFDANVGLSCLDQIESKAIESFQPYWATRAYLLAELGHNKEALIAFEKAIELCQQPAIKQYLKDSKDNLSHY